MMRERGGDLTSDHLVVAFQAGAQRVIQQKNHLNGINVFPVEDGDTGSNLASLMSSLLEEALRQMQTTQEVFTNMADAALVGARGNSGIIFAQYLNGLASRLTDSTEKFSTSAFATSAKFAVEDAYQAIEKPVEGTMITVIREWAETLFMHKETERDIEPLLEKGLEAAKKALSETPKQLKILKKKSVVDAGAKGFVLFIEGFTEAICDSNFQLENKEEGTEYVTLMQRDGTQHESDEEPIFRYCTEVLLAKTTATSTAIKEQLAGLGDSLIVANSPSRTRIHIHTNQPEEVVHRLRQVGEIQQQKADDMLMQYQLKKGPKHAIALVTDSIADLPQEFIFNNQIQVLPMNLLIDSVSYLDKVTLQPSYFYKLNRLAKENPTSAQPNSKTVENLFSFLGSHYQEIIVVTVAGKLSGTYQMIKEVAKKFQTNNLKIAVIDSKQNSAAEGLVVMNAAEWIAEGLPFNQVVENVELATQTTEILVSVNELDAMVRSGRLPGIAGKIAKFINLKPIVGLDQAGGGKINGVAFSTAGNEKKIMNKIKKRRKAGEILRYAVIHANDLERATKLSQEFTKEIGFPPTYLMEISTVVAMSAGEGCVAIALSWTEGRGEKG